MPIFNGERYRRRVGVQPKILLPLARDQLRPPELCQDNGEALKPHAPFVRGNCIERMFNCDTGNRHKTFLAPLSLR